MTRQPRPRPPDAGTVTTDRLLLEPLGSEHLDEVFELHADPRVWDHLPSGRHTHRRQSEQLVAEVRRAWGSIGLS